MVKKTIIRKNKRVLPKRVKNDVLSYIELIKKDKIPIEKVIVFGSYAKGKPHKWSDIDICIISPNFKKPFSVLHYLLKKSYQIKSIIEPHPYHPKDFINEDPLVWEIKKTGIEVMAK